MLVLMDENHRPDCEQLRERVAELEARLQQLARARKWRLALAGALPLLAAVVLGVSLTVWALKVQSQAETAVQQTLAERDQARKDEAEAKQQLDQAQEEGQTKDKERDEAYAAERAAQHSADDAKAVLSFFQDNVLLAPGRPKSWTGGGLGKDVTLRKAVDRAASRISEAFPDRPMVEASIREVLGASYLDLGEAEQAVKQYKQAYQLRREVLGLDNPLTGDCRNKLAVAYREAGHTDEASSLFELDPNPSSRTTTLTLQGLALLSQKKSVEAELKLRECLAIRLQTQPDDWATFHTKVLLGAALLDQKKYREAEPLLLSGYEGMKQREAKLTSPDRVHVTKALERLVQLYEAWGKKDEAARWQKDLQEKKATTKP